MKRLSLLIAAAIIFCSPGYSFKKKEIMVRSESMNKDVPVTVITPDSYRKAKALPVIYLLHGHGGDHESWAKEGVSALSDKYNVIFVLPDGGKNSWYFDSPITPEYKYETFVSKELVSYIDSNYKTVSDRSGRAITGLSMGGHGALYIAIRHQDTFGSAGSTSGGVDFRPFPKKWGIALRLGSIEEYPENWDNNTVINMTHLLKPGSLNLIIDCGTEDFFYKVNCNLHDKLLKEGIPHEFHSRPGAHNWNYWNNSVQYQVLYFSNCFN